MLSLRTCALLGALCLPSIAQTQLYRFDGKAGGDALGQSVAVAGDVDGDGFDDIVAGAPGDDLAGFFYGSVKVFSGLDGRVLHEFFGDEGTSSYGEAVDGAGDVNGDGRADILVGDSWHSVGGVARGRVTVYSGLDGTVLFQLDGPAANDNFGAAVAGLGDLTGDGLGEFAVGAPLADNAFSGAGRVTVYNGKNGQELFSVEGSSLQANLGGSLAAAGDVDGDGVGDLVAGAEADDSGAVNAGRVLVVSGADGSTLMDFVGTTASASLGASVARAGDVDGDGLEDIIAGATQFPLGPGFALVLSPANGSVIHRVDGSAVAVLVGTSVSTAGDIDGDGFSEFAVGRNGFGEGVQVFDGRTAQELYDLQAPVISGTFGGSVGFGDPNGDGIGDLVVGAQSITTGSVFNHGSVFVFSTRPLPLAADGHLALLGSGSTTTFSLEAGPDFANDFYWILGSTAGVSPGLQLGSVLLPLNGPDAYLDLTLMQPNSVYLPTSVGSLDGNGSAQSTLVIPPGTDPSLAGLSVHHAYLVFDSQTFYLQTASNAVPALLQ